MKLPIDIKFIDEKRGKGVFANTNIKKSELIFEEKPVTSSPFPINKVLACDLYCPNSDTSTIHMEALCNIVQQLHEVHSTLCTYNWIILLLEYWISIIGNIPAIHFTWPKQIGPEATRHRQYKSRTKYDETALWTRSLLQRVMSRHAPEKISQFRLQINSW